MLAHEDKIIMTADFKKIEESTQAVYEENAKQYDIERGRSLFERNYLDLFISFLKEDAHILDLGCGAGEPIARYFIEKGLKLSGADYSEAMLSLCRERFPNQQWLYCDMRNYALKERYDGIISWGAFFHLSIADQRKNLPLICQSLKEEGILLLTVGPSEGEVTGTVAGKKVYHASLSPQEYEKILNDNDLEILSFKLNDPDCHGFSVLVAKKIN